MNFLTPHIFLVFEWWQMLTLQEIKWRKKVSQWQQCKMTILLLHSKFWWSTTRRSRPRKFELIQFVNLDMSIWLQDRLYISLKFVIWRFLSLSGCQYWFCKCFQSLYDFKMKCIKKNWSDEDESSGNQFVNEKKMKLNH